MLRTLKGLGGLFVRDDKGRARWLSTPNRSIAESRRSHRLRPGALSQRALPGASAIASHLLDVSLVAATMQLKRDDAKSARQWSCRGNCVPKWSLGTSAGGTKASGN